MTGTSLSMTNILTGRGYINTVSFCDEHWDIIDGRFYDFIDFLMEKLRLQVPLGYTDLMVLLKHYKWLVEHNVCDSNHRVLSQVFGYKEV